jgi:protein required for attachment to host cells
VTFVSQAAIEDGLAHKLGTAKQLCRENTRGGISKASMVLNDALTARSSGSRSIRKPTRSAPMANLLTCEPASEGRVRCAADGAASISLKTTARRMFRPGRLADGMGSAHRSAVQETDWHRLAKHEFAHKIASLLEQEAQADRFDQLVIVAPSVIMGELRKSFSGSVEGRIVAEVAKDLTGHPVPEIEKLLFG